MSRSGYSEDCEHLELWRGVVEKAIRGKRGQKLLRDMATALDALPAPRLVADTLEEKATGEVCALGAVARLRAVDLTDVDEYEPTEVADALDISQALAQEVAYINDEYAGARNETPEARFTRVRKWVAEQIVA